jgi:molybdopterin-dependent oxidoreductase alpha subunit
MMTELRNASRRGVPIAVLNPLRERALERFAAPQDPVEMVTLSSTRIASEYCQVSVGGDVAALKGIMKLVLEAHDTAVRTDDEPVLDVAFIEQHTHGFSAFAEDLRRTNWEDILRVSGLSREQTERVAKIYMKANAVIVCYGMGITQHRHGSENVQQLANLLLLRGNFGKPGAGICPVRGHSNVQGDRTVGIDEKPKPELLDQIERVFGFKPPRTHGHTVVDALQAMIEGRAKVFVGLGGNFVVAVPEKPIAETAMRRLRLTVGISTKLNRGHLVHGEQALILPCLARSDIDIQKSGRQSITVEDSMSMVHASAGLVQPPSRELKSEVAIVCGIARAALLDDGIGWSAFEDNYDVIRDRIENVFPALFRDFNRRIRQPGGFHLPIPPRDRVWNTPTGRANFLLFEGVAEDMPVGDASVLRLATLRSHNQYNTTIYGLDDRYRGVFGGRMVVFMNELDMKERGIAPGALVEIESLANDGQRRVVRGFKSLPYRVPRGSICAYYPETNPLLALAHHDLAKPRQPNQSRFWSGRNEGRQFFRRHFRRRRSTSAICRCPWGSFKQCARARSKWRLGAPGHTSGFRGCRHDLRRQHAADLRRHPELARACRIGLYDPHSSRWAYFRTRCRARAGRIALDCDNLRRHGPRL